MDLTAIVELFGERFVAKYSHRLLSGHLEALRSIRRCRTTAAGELQMRCPECAQVEWRPRSCGHRSCPKCQNYEASRWLDRQQTKLLPVSYFMVTFTLPFEFRPLARRCQAEIYASLFDCAINVLKDFGLNPKHLGAELGLTAVLHTQTRRLDYHPHLHVIVPGGGIDRRRRQWRKVKGKYLFNEFNLARVFRARFLAAIKRAGLRIPYGAPEQWMVDAPACGFGAAGPEIPGALSLSRRHCRIQYCRLPQRRSDLSLPGQRNGTNLHPHPERGRLSLAGPPARSPQGLPQGTGLRLPPRKCQAGLALGAVRLACHGRTESLSAETGVSLPTLQSGDGDSCLSTAAMSVGLAQTNRHRIALTTKAGGS